MATKAKAKAKASDEDDLLAGKANGKAKPAAKKTAAKAKPKKASAEDVDDLLETKASAKSKGNGKAKPAKAKAKAKPAARAEDIADTDDVSKALLKLKKATSYADIHERTGFNIRQIRRTARRMRDNGELAFTKQGTEVLVQAA